MIYPIESNKYFASKLSAFSISQIHGAYCDDGQNYKNLILLVKGLSKFSLYFKNLMKDFVRFFCYLRC